MRRSTYFLQFAAPSEVRLPFEPIGAATIEAQSDNCVRFRSGRTIVEVAGLASDVFRVGMFGDGRRVDYRSEAVAKQEWPTIATTVTTQSGVVNLDTGSMAARIELEPLRIGFAADGRQFAVDDSENGMGFVRLAPPDARLVDPLGAPSIVYKRHSPGTHYFGCGERTGGLEKTDSRQVFWNIDPPAGHTASLNNLYTSVPFMLALHDGRAWGMFVDSTYRQEFDLAREDPSRCGFAIDGGPLIYYVFGGPTPRAVLERYTELTGRIPMPPRWALGNHQSRWGYKSADDLLKIARAFRERGIPLDALYLDIDYMDGYRVFTWDAQRFPDPAGLVRELDKLGVKLVTIVDPGVKVDENYEVYTSGRAGELFCKTFLGEEYHNVVWPGLCAFPDFTNPATREWWGSHLPALLDAGVSGIWCDMNEPTGFVPTPDTFPPDVTHRGESEPLLHAQVHNVYGQLMARATHEGVRKLRPERRPFVISRAGFAGLQRYALHWTGDNTSWWEHIWMSMPQLQNLGLSGYAWVGVDIGGFAGDATGELLARWTEFGIFQPFCRNHSAWDTHPQEPWAFGAEYEKHIRSMLMLRQRLIPYLYTLFDEAHRTGAPILRALLFEYPEDRATYTADDEFLLGHALLIAPIARPGVEHRHVYLPAGTWVHLWTGQRHRGPAHILAHAPLGRPAVFVRANTPVPLWPSLMHAGEWTPEPLPLTWAMQVAVADDGDGELYEDAGEGYAFEQGQFARTRATCRISADSVTIEFETMHRPPDWPMSRVELDVRGVEHPREVAIDGVALNDWQHADGRLLIQLPHPARSVRIATRPTMDA